MGKRIFLFTITNIAIIVTISIVCSIVGVNRFLTTQGIDYKALLIFCLIWGMTGSFISLQISRWIAKTSLGVKVITPESAGELYWLVEMVTRLSKQAELPAYPEIGIFEQSEPNAFATGPSKSRSLVAFSTGIIASMPRQELEAVAAHEISHIKNGDMVTMTLIQGVVNTFVMFLSRIFAYAISQFIDERYSRFAWYVSTFIFEILFGILGSLVTARFSRQREFRADNGAALMTSPKQMIGALATLQTKLDMAEGLPAGLAVFGISSRPKGSLLHLFSTHPPIEERIKALQKA